VIAVLVALTAGCASRSSPADPILPDVLVSPATGDKPHRISIAALPPNRQSVRRALDSAGIDLRDGGGRDHLAIRYLPLDLAAESRLLDAAELDPDAFSEPRAFGATDAIQVRSVAGSETPIGFTLHLLPTTHKGRFTGFEAGALVRPERGTLLPMLRGNVLAGHSGSVLVVGEAGGDPVFVTLIRLQIAGTEEPVRLVAPKRHRVEVRQKKIPTRSLADTLKTLGLPARTGRFGLDTWVLGADATARLNETLAVAADDLDAVDIVAPGPDGTAERFAFGDAALWIFPRLDQKTWRYESRFWLGGETREPECVEHGVNDLILIARWNQAGRGMSLIAVIRLTPLP